MRAPPLFLQMPRRGQLRNATTAKLIAIDPAAARGVTGAAAANRPRERLPTGDAGSPASAPVSPPASARLTGAPSPGNAWMHSSTSEAGSGAWQFMCRSGIAIPFRQDEPVLNAFGIDP